jgi:hypothetical protein
MSGTVEWRRQTTVEKASAYSSQFNTVYSAFGTKPGDTEAGYMDTMVRALVSGGYWDRFDILYIMSSNTSANAFINWKNPGTYNLTDPESTNPTFTAYEGFAGDGSSDYLSTNFEPSAHQSSATRTDASMGIYVRSWTNGEVAFGASGYSDGLSRTALKPHDSAVVYTAYINSGGTSTQYSSMTEGHLGLNVISRTGETTNEIFHNGVSVGTSTASARDYTCDAVLYLLAQNSLETPSETVDNFYQGQVSIAFYMDGINETEADGIYDIFQAYMTSLDKEV